MLNQQVTSDESSVVFNLRQLMQLEQDRLQAEADAARERQAAAERARAERAAAELAQQAQRAAAELAEQAERARRAERSELDRQAALLRVRLEAEALERSAREQRALEHTRALQAGRRTRAAILVGGLCVAVIGAAVAQRVLQAPPVRPAANSGEQALLAAQAHELEQLRQHVSRLRAPVEPALAPAASVTPTRQPAKPGRKSSARAQTRRSGDELDGLDEGGDDPIDSL